MKPLKKTKNIPLHLSYFIAVVAIILGSCNNQPGTPKEIFSDDETPDVRVTGSGMDSIKLAGIRQHMEKFVDEKKIAGAVTLVARNGQIASFEAVGFQNIRKKLPMTRNTVFRIASMTKPFAAASVMMLCEEGKLKLDDPVEKYLPEFRNIWLASDMTDDRAVFIRPARNITIRDVLTHTSGLSSLPEDAPVSSIKEYNLVISGLPLLFQPGSQWSYSGSGITAAARIVEVLSGKKYEEFLSERIFIPLGMKNTIFYSDNKSWDIVAALYQPSDDSSLVTGPEPGWLMGFPRPEGGLLSTAHDMYIWMQTMLNGGIFNGQRILTEQSVREMTKVNTGDLQTGFTDGMGFGLGFGVVRHPSGVTGMLSEGTFGHGGAFGTQYWADPVKNIIYILMIQRQGFGNGDASDIRFAFQKIASEAIVE